MSNDAFLNQINRPSRYLGQELGSIRKQQNEVDVTFALAFPDVYEVGMSHIGFAILYHVLNGCEGVQAERIYAPWPDYEQHLRQEGEAFCSLECSRPLGQFDVIGFTLQYELSFTNLINMLDLAGIPRRQAERNGEYPLIVVGGPGAFNPEPLADFIDCAVIGDGEEAVVDICAALREARAAGEDRSALLRRLGRIPGIYVPSHYQVDYQADGRIASITPLADGAEKVKRRFLTDLESAPYPDRPIVPFMNTVHNRVAMEIARGCTRGCRFCQAGYIYRPVRERSPERIGQLIADSLRHSGFDEVSLLSLSSGDYSQIEPLLAGLMECHAASQVAVSLPSLRVGSLTQELMEQIQKVRKTGFTLAPEAGSERLREVINKGIRAEDLIEGARTAFGLGWRLIKLYFMIGLPTETAADRSGIVELARQVKKSGAGSQGGADVNVSASTFVPKPHTPFQWERQISMAETEQIQAELRSELKKNKLRFKYHDSQMSFLEGVFARGDRRLAALLEAAVDGGCRFDGWSDHFDFGRWQQAFASSGTDPDWYLRQRSKEETLPWDHIDCGIPKSFFLAERERADQQAYTPDCRHGDCHACGLCDFESLRVRQAERNRLPQLPPRPSQPADPEQDRYKIRLRLRKDGRARFVAHLEFMTVLLRACRRAGLPLRYSGGFHPSPKFSFPDALPTGVASEAEIIDLELFRPLSAQEVVEGLNAELPQGFSVLEGATVHWQTPSPSASIETSHYRLGLPPERPADLEGRCAEFLAATAVPGQRLKKGRPIAIDLRPDVVGLELQGEQLLLSLRRGSPLPVLAHLLQTDVEAIRRLSLCKVGVEFKS